jgi:hypothetical protein
LEFGIGCTFYFLEKKRYSSSLVNYDDANTTQKQATPNAGLGLD